MLLIWLEKHNILSWIITFFGAGLIFYMSSLTFEGTQVASYLPPIYHFFAFLFLCAFLLISLHKGKWSKKKFILGVVIVVLYAILDEVHQLFVAGRFFDFLDMFIDFLGIFFASLIYYKRLK